MPKMEQGVTWNTLFNVAQIHDELVLEVREEVLPHAARLVRRVMEVRPQQVSTPTTCSCRLRAARCLF